jgi:hypothetical protein
MKTHRPWQPHVSSSPLFNPYHPTYRATTLDHFDLIEEEKDETEMSQDELRDEAENESALKNRD